MPRFIKYWLPVIVYAGLIFHISSVPGEDIPALFFGQDIIFHFFEYAGLAFLIKRALKEYSFGKDNLRRLFWVCLFVIIYAILDEFHQQFVPNRSSSFSDIVIDGMGSVLGGILYR